jgi:hypothetical protein
MKQKKDILIEKYLQPSEIIYKYDSLGKKYTIKFWRNRYGELHSTFDHPAKTSSTNSGNFLKKWWYKDGYLNRDKKKSYVIIYHDEIKTYESNN